MQIIMTYAQAQQHILDVAKSLARNPGSDSMVVTLPGEWSTEHPTEPGRYWTWAAVTEEPYLMELVAHHGRLYDDLSGLSLKDMTAITHWLRVFEPQPPTVEATE